MAYDTSGKMDAWTQPLKPIQSPTLITDLFVSKKWQ